MKHILVGLLCGLARLTSARADAPAKPKLKTVRVLAIGNRFSKDATRFLPQIVAADGRFELILEL